MMKYEHFTFLCNQTERALIAVLAERRHCSQSDAVRLLICEAVREMKSKNQITSDVGAGASRGVQSLPETNITSNNQSGGITAHSVIVYGGIRQTNFAAGELKKENKPIWGVLHVISAIARFLAAIATILQYLRIFHF